MDQQIFLEGIAKLSAIFNHTLTELELATYLETLSSLYDEAWGYAHHKACGEMHKFPKPIELREFARMHRVPAKQIEHHESKPDPSYVKARMAIINRVIDGQANRATAMELSKLADKWPEKSESLIAESVSWWNQPDDENSVSHWHGGC